MKPRIAKPQRGGRETAKGIALEARSRIRPPQGLKGRDRSLVPQIPLVELNPRFRKEAAQLVLKAPSAVVRGLIDDVMPNRFSIRRAHGKRGSDDALRDARLLVATALHVRQEPTVIAQLVAESIELYAMQGLADWSFRHRKPAYAAELETMLNGRPRPNPMRENAEILYGTIRMVEQTQTPEGREKLGLQPEDEPGGIYKLFAFVLDKGAAKVRLVKSLRDWFAALDAPREQRLDRLNAATHEKYKALLAFPTAAMVLEKLSAGEEHVAYRVEHWEATQLKYRAALRALRLPEVPRTIRTDDLLSPFDGKPVRYRFDGRQIVVEVSAPEGLERGPSPLVISRNPASAP
jgi:hypothetical protein